MVRSLQAHEEVVLRIHCWKGYAQPYTQGFQELVKNKYNIDLRLEISNVSDPTEFWDRARTRTADLISPAHNLPKSPHGNFIKAGLIIPINLANIPNYRNILPFLQYNELVSHNGQVYGVPYTMGPYGLAYNANQVEEPKSWSVLWSKEAQGRYTIARDYPDCNVYTTLLVFGLTHEDLYDVNRSWAKIDPRLIQEKLNRLAMGAFSLWGSTANPDEFNQLHYAATWGYGVAVANKQGGNWKMAHPREGVTMWADHWLITAAVKGDVRKKRLCEEWINYCLGHELQVGVIRNWGVSPVVTDINDLLTKEEIATFKAGNNDYWQTLSLWKFQGPRTANAHRMMWSKALKRRLEVRP